MDIQTLKTFLVLADNKPCWKMGLFLLCGMTLFLVISTVYPNGQMLRPDTFARDNFCVDLVRRLYESDTSTNIMPSMHVFNAVGMHIALCMTPKLEKFKWIRKISGVLMVLIVLSTMFLKQHSVWDVIVAIALDILFYFVFYRWIPKQIDKKDRPGLQNFLNGYR